MERRSEERQPISLRVEFKTVRGLVCEYTTSVAKGGCTIRSPQAVEPGTVFLLRLVLEGSTTRSLEIEGKVKHSTARSDKGFDIGIHYLPASTPRRIATTRFLDQVFAEQLANRKHARVPVNLVAKDARESGLQYLVRDLSRGGMGLYLPAGRALAPERHLGERAELAVWYEGEVPFTFGASVVRLVPQEGTRQAMVAICFDELSEANQRMVDALLYLHRPDVIMIRFPGEPSSA